MGSWNHELKRADWRKVDTLAVNALTAQSKDLQLVGWLLEAQIHQTGFSGIAPCITLMHALCDRYWTELHPQADGDDLEYRANVIRWINDKMLTALRLVPITVTGRGRDYCWSDWEQAHRNEQLRAAVGSRDASSIEGVTTSELMAGFAMRLEPHSPVPYLIRRATEWGNLNTVELYQELFLKLGGQLNIFEMLGLESTTDVKN
jgi:type VI secretion system protein ImpA